MSYIIQYSPVVICNDRLMHEIDQDPIPSSSPSLLPRYNATGNPFTLSPLKNFEVTYTCEKSQYIGRLGQSRL